jgi:hypothetical protein
MVSSGVVKYELFMELNNKSLKMLGKDIRRLLVVCFVVDSWKLVEGLYRIHIHNWLDSYNIVLKQDNLRIIYGIVT